MNIVLIGIGKIAKLHYRAWKSIYLNKPINFIFVDKYKNEIDSFFGESIKIYKTLEEMVKDIKIDVKNDIIDICVYTHEAPYVVRECVEKIKIKNIIVEKPYEFKEEYDAHIFMIQNYEHSLITKKLIDNFIKINKIPENIKIEFSKNRLEDTLKKRGFKNKIPKNLEIEMPHELYLLILIVENLEKKFDIDVLIEFVEKKELELDLNSKTREWYTELKYILHIKNTKVNVELKSNLLSDRTIKTVCIEYKKESIESNYIIYDKNFKQTTQGNLKIIKNNKINVEYVNKDENIEECIKYYNKIFKLSKVEKNKEYQKYLKRIERFKNLYKQAIQ